MANQNEPAADTDDDLPPGADGRMVKAGLPAVMEWLAELGVEFHKGQCPGLSLPELMHKLRSVRPAVSKNKGFATFAVNYTTMGGEWRALVKILKVDRGQTA